MVAAKRARAATKAAASSSSSSGPSNGSSKAQEVTGEIPLGKHLASTEKKVRDGAIRSLARFLEQAGTERLDPAEMAKLWKGLFYCFWMSDKPLVQQALAQELADILLKIRIDAASSPSSSSSAATSSSTLAPLDFLEGFFDAMVREWTGIDKWRVPKFLLLFRRFVNAAFRFLAREGWSGEGVDRLNAMLLKENGPLNSNNPKVSKGVTFHLLDVYLEELDGALQSPEPRREGQDDNGAEAGFCPTRRLMEPFVHMAACCFDAATYERIMEKVFDPLLEDCLVRTAEVQLREAEEEEEEEKEKGPKRKRARKPDDEEADEDSSVQFLAILKATRGDALDLRKDIFEALFEEASKPEANGARRKKIYAMFRREEERIEEEEEEEEEREGAEEQDEV